jgi:hypothetical protein
MKTVTGQISITISPEEEKEIALAWLCKELGWDRNNFIDEDQMVKCFVVRHTTHAWEEVETIREATDTDTALSHVLKQLL